MERRERADVPVVDENRGEISLLLDIIEGLPLNAWEETPLETYAKSMRDRIYSASVEIPNRKIQLKLEFMSELRAEGYNLNDDASGYYIYLSDLETKDAFGEQLGKIYHIGTGSEEGERVQQVMDKIKSHLDDVAMKKTIGMREELIKDIFSAYNSNALRPTLK